MPKADAIETEKRLRAVQEWIIDDWPGVDIIRQCVAKWGVSERQAKRYIATARARWAEEEAETIEQKRRQRIAALKKLKRSMKPEFLGTPKGIQALVRVEKLIIELEGSSPGKKMVHSTPPDQPLQLETTHKVIFQNYGE